MCHEWAGFLTFVPDPANGPHRLALDTAGPSSAGRWLGWLDETLVRGVPEESRRGVVGSTTDVHWK